MSCYWARFEKIENDIFRYDTRIYLKPIDSPGEDDMCLGAIVGKNPGSAIANSLDETALQRIKLDGDKLLPNIKNIFLKAYEKSDISVNENAYIQVLNLMYICDKDLSQAIKKIKVHKKPAVCLSEDKHFPFIWYLWGNEDKDLNPYKGRFLETKLDNCFFLNTKTEEIVGRIPTKKEAARHPQGMRHDLVVPYISELLLSIAK